MNTWYYLIMNLHLLHLLHERSLRISEWHPAELWLGVPSFLQGILTNCQYSALIIVFNKTKNVNDFLEHIASNSQG